MIKGLIIEQRYNVYHVIYNDEIFLCKPKGLIKFNNDNLMVGDWVMFNRQTKIIDEILPRTNSLVRPKIANVNQAIIVMSITQPEFNFQLLVKYLIQLELNRIEHIVICLTKTDLINLNEVKYKNIIDQLKMDQYLIYNINNNQDFLNFKACFNHKTSIMVGQTGVGKSTLINKLLNQNLQKTQEISQALKRGKHTTTGTKLIKFLNGYIADSPGFSSFEHVKDKKILAKSFIDFNEYAAKCQFKDCLHDNEINCNVKKQFLNGKISKWRYDLYLGCIKEKQNNNEFNKKRKEK